MASGLKPEFPGDDLDPYAPPRSKLGQSDRGRWPGEVSFDLGCILVATWPVYRQRLGTCVGLCGTVLVLTVAAQIVPLHWLRNPPLPRGEQWPLLLARFAIFFASYVFGTWLGLGQRLALLGLLRREPDALAWVVRGGRHVLTTLLAGTLLVLILGMIVLISMLLGAMAGGILGRVGPVRIQAYAAAMSLAFATTAYVAMRCSQFAYMIVDRNAGVLDSLTDSWQATRSRVVTLILVYILWLAINVGGLLAYGVGVFFTVPFTSLMLAVTYLSLTGQPLVGWEEALEDGDRKIPHRG